MRSAAPVLVLVGSVVVALLTTRGEMGAPPATAGLVALGVVIALVSVVGWRLGSDSEGSASSASTASTASPRSAPAPRRRVGRALLLALLLAALALAAAQDYLRPGITFGHDIPHHSWAVWSLWRCVLDGDWFPRWNPYLSLGIPLLQFYAPLPYVLAWPAQALGASPSQALSWLMVLGQWGTGLSLLLSVRWLRGSWPAALLAAGAAMLAPYHLMDQTFRLALGETMAFPWIVPFAVASWKLARGERGRAGWVLGVCAGALLFTHLITLIMASFVGAIVVVLAWTLARDHAPRPRGASLRTLALVATLTVGATAAWLLPAVVEAEHTSINDISRPGRAISPYAVFADEPVTRALWPRYDIRRRIGDGGHPGRGMPMYFGWALLGLLGLALARPRGPASDPEGASSRASSPPAAPSASPDPAADPRLWAAVALGLLLLSIWPLAMALDGVPILGRIMFPWRLYAPASVLAALAGGLALDRWPTPRALFLAVALAALAVDVAPYLGAAQRFDDHEGLGAVAFRGAKPVPIEGIPRDQLVRVEGLRLPPSDYDWQLLLGRRAFPDYMSSTLRRRYGRSSKPPTVEESEFYGASFRVRRARAQPQVLSPDPMVSLRPEGGEWAGAEDAVLTVLPERLTVALPAGTVASDIRISFGWFPGWEYRVDGGPWRPAQRRSWLLSGEVPDGAQRVEYRYSAWRPWDRAAGLVISALTWLGLLGWRLRRRPDPDPA